MIRSLHPCLIPICAISILPLLGCAPRAWVMEKGEGRGAVGYRLDLSPSERDEALQAKIPCSGYEIVRDERVKAGPDTIEALPVTIQPTAKTADALGTQAPNIGQPGAGKNQDYGPTYPTVETESPIDGSFGRLEYKCPPAAEGAP